MQAAIHPSSPSRAVSAQNPACEIVFATSSRMMVFVLDDQNLPGRGPCCVLGAWQGPCRRHATRALGILNRARSRIPQLGIAHRRKLRLVGSQKEGGGLVTRCGEATPRRPAPIWVKPYPRRGAAGARSAHHHLVEGDDQPLEVADLVLEQGSPVFRIPLGVQLLDVLPCCSTQVKYLRLWSALRSA